jgi:hypothetical protein
VSIVTHGLALNITIQSYAGKLYYGLISCRQTIPDLDRFGRDLKAAHHELVVMMHADLSTPAPVDKQSARPPAATKKKKLVKRAPKPASVHMTGKTPKTVAKPATKRVAKTAANAVQKTAKKKIVKVMATAKSTASSARKKRA